VEASIDTIQTKGEIGQTTFSAKDSRQGVTFTSNVLTSGFPGIHMDRFFANNFKIDSVMGKTTWTYLLSFQYVIKISVHHKWGQDTKLAPKSP
jgi:hypothetical protein